MGKSVIIVGAGIAGLSAGCYLRKNGFETTIFESHTIPGGLCTVQKPLTLTISRRHKLTTQGRS